ncbi:MAG: thioesterase [Clostridiales bacterium]|nr:thioesterase [Clostridiales bacterium]
MISQMFCLPYAGGSASIYNDWKYKFGNELDIYPIEYAGHGSRFCEEYYSCLEEAASDVCEQISRHQTGDYVIYGHSMGCLIALETAFQLTEKKANLPKAVIVAATRPPHLMYKDKPLGTLSRDELMKEIASMGQMEPEVLEYEELYEIVADVLYSDIQMFTRYKRVYGNEHIDIPVLALTSDGDDEAPSDDMTEWQNYTNSSFNMHCFTGNHFFAFNDNPVFYSFIKEYLEKL